ncbi:MAG: toll/interleukin-1 receptor domain-containing protein [Dehalococcoidia bacterium]
MRVFISWSGERSGTVARALRDWVPNVIQAVRPWMSDSDIAKGARWSSDIALQLEESRVGVICLTPENLQEPWILFEAGALSKTLEDTFVCPYLYDLQSADITGPLAQFQATKPEKEDTRSLIQTINRALREQALPEPNLNTIFDKWWPDLEKSLKAVPRPEKKPAPQRSDRKILEEILELVREQKRLTPPTTLPPPLPPSLLSLSRLLETSEAAKGVKFDRSALEKLGKVVEAHRAKWNKSSEEEDKAGE